MLPTPNDNGARLAAILPTGLRAVARGLGPAALAALDAGIGAHPGDDGRIPDLRSFVMVVVDGLGHANLGARKGHAPALARLPRRRIETVAPSTTAAALTTLTTGALPGRHGLIGYRIRHPQRGLVTTLKDWAGIDRAEWQRATPLFGIAAAMGARPVAIGRPAHAVGGLTEAILAGAEYRPGQRIEDRFAEASALLRSGDPIVAYLYVDELDKAAHEHGWESPQWVRRLEQLDGALDGLLRALPGDVGVVVTADHGMVDVGPERQIFMDADPALLADVAEVGGEPRFRSLYLAPGADAGEVARRWAESEGASAWIGTRDEAIAAGCFGPVDAAVAPRLGDVIVAARRRVAYVRRTDDPRALEMVGQHGSFTDEERGVPLALGGALAGSGFASAVERLAAS